MHRECGLFKEQEDEVPEEQAVMLGSFLLRTGPKDRLCEGSFCHCWRGTDSFTGREVAIKMYKESKTPGATIKKFTRQIQVLQEFALPFDVDNVKVLKERNLWHECFSSEPSRNLFVELMAFSKGANGKAGMDPFDGTLYVVTELAQLSLQVLLEDARKRKYGSEELLDQAKALAGPVLMATAALHAKRFVHLDIKPSNVMSFNGRWKITNVDSCLKVGTILDSRSTLSFSPCYSSPEFAHFVVKRLTIELRPSLDAWTVGLVLLEMLEPNPVFYNKFKSFNTAEEFLTWHAHDFAGLLDQVLQRTQAQVHPSFSAGIRGLLAESPTERQTCAEVLQDPYFGCSLKSDRSVELMTV